MNLKVDELTVGNMLMEGVEFEDVTINELEEFIKKFKSQEDNKMKKEMNKAYGMVSNLLSEVSEDTVEKSIDEPKSVDELFERLGISGRMSNAQKMKKKFNKKKTDGVIQPEKLKGLFGELVDERLIRKIAIFKRDGNLHVMVNITTFGLNKAKCFGDIKRVSDKVAEEIGEEVEFKFIKGDTGEVDRLIRKIRRDGNLIQVVE